jgi:hypothetical protein
MVCCLTKLLAPTFMPAQTHQYDHQYHQATQYYQHAQAAYPQASAHFEPQSQDSSWAQPPIPCGMVGYDVGPSNDYYEMAEVPGISSTSQRRRASAGYYGQDMAMSMNATPISTAPPLSIARMSTPGIPVHHGQHHHGQYDYHSQRPASPGQFSSRAERLLRS